MKIKSIYLCLLLLLGVAISACEDQRSDGMVDPSIYIVNEGIQDITMYNTGLPFIYHLGVYQSGMDNGANSVSISIFDETALAAYNSENNTNFNLIPSDCYSLESKTLSVSGNTPNASFEVTFDPAKILALPEYGVKEYALPFALSDVNIAINLDKSISVIVPNVIDPIVYLAKTGFNLNTLSDNGESSIIMELPVEMDFENIFDLEVALAINQDLITDYNTANGTVFELLPAGSYSIDVNPLTISKGSSNGLVTVTVNRDQLVYGSYILPLQLSTLSNYNISAVANSCLFAVNYEAALLDRSEWEVIDFSTEEPKEANWGPPIQGSAVAILDDDVATFWHSRWDNERGGLAPLDHHITVDMKKELTVCQIDLVRRANNRDTKAGEFYTSLDNVTWTKIGTYRMEETNEAQPFAVAKTQARYLKFVVTESNRDDVGNLAEMYVRGIE